MILPSDFSAQSKNTYFLTWLPSVIQQWHHSTVEIPYFKSICSHDLLTHACGELIQAYGKMWPTTFDSESCWSHAGVMFKITMVYVGPWIHHLRNGNTLQEICLDNMFIQQNLQTSSSICHVFTIMPGIKVRGVVLSFQIQIWIPKILEASFYLGTFHKKAMMVTRSCWSSTMTT